MNKVLMIAFHFPPVAMGSGHLRTLGFVRYLPPLGWEPIVLSANAMAFPRTDVENNKLIPEGCQVHRAFALDASRHMAIAGKYPGVLAQPDRWSSWWPAAVAQGLHLIRKHQISAIWSTYPIMTSHCIAHTLSSMTKLPWIADFRDPVASSVSAANRFAVASQHRWEGRVLRRAARTVFTTPGALNNYAARYPEPYREGRLSVIENGYDEAAFTGLPPAPSIPSGRPLVLLHSGLLYPDGRNPFPFFAAIANLKAAGTASTDNLRIVLRASGSEAVYEQEIRRLGLEDIVVLAPPISSSEALIEQAKADALLLFQGPKFDRQIPAKLYEYLRIARPIFALVGEQGDTAAVLRESGGATLVSPDDVADISRNLAAFLHDIREGAAPKASQDFVAQRSRQAGASLLANLLDQIADQTPRP
ncbi:hypothetical protein PY254_01435 [Rhodanobacter sp. AS-Z3]|uniref:hypothetical protein n=1 Tax=Rhodanobacter sp. AS-Z3 TaxID=3031330 RepID=UPI002479F0D0|nr:hypothetical protein [Rhodanobacter sp. AS-Z3]WEN15371.1 hypothetical protein PY254_01435 [Rhodanobacter sp. AS-Z3]